MEQDGEEDVRGLREEARVVRSEGRQEAVVRPLRKDPWGRAATAAEDVRGLQGEAGELRPHSTKPQPLIITVC